MVSLIFKIFFRNKVYVKNNSKAVLTSTHNQCFRAKIRKISKKVLITWTCYPEDSLEFYPEFQENTSEI